MTAEAPAAATFEAWFDVHMRGQIVSHLYEDDLRCAYERGRADEREACAQLAEQHKAIAYDAPDDYSTFTRPFKHFADLIRARKDTP